MTNKLKPSYYSKNGKDLLSHFKEMFTDDMYVGFLTGNVIKYLIRWKDKNGTEDLKKAKVYLNKLLEFSNGENKERQETSCPYCKTDDFRKNDSSYNKELNYVKGTSVTDHTTIIRGADYSYTNMGIVQYDKKDGYLIDIGTDSFHVTIPIKYCPECGRKLC